MSNVLSFKPIVKKTHLKDKSVESDLQSYMFKLITKNLLEKADTSSPKKTEMAKTSSAEVVPFKVNKIKQKLKIIKIIEKVEHATHYFYFINHLYFQLIPFKLKV